MYGWRGRIGVIISPPNTVVEMEFAQMAPEGVSVHAARLGRPPGLAGQLGSNVVRQTNDDLPRAAASLTELRLSAVAFAHTAGSMVEGPEYDAELVSMLSETVGCPGITTASATVAALKSAKVRKLALLTPYPQEMTLMEVKFLEKAVPGLKVVTHCSLELTSGLSIGDMEPAAFYGEAHNLDVSKADALFISGTNGRTIEVIELLEGDLGKPVFTANQVTMWATLGVMGIHPKPGYGSLFDMGWA